MAKNNKTTLQDIVNTCELTIKQKQAIERISMQMGVAFNPQVSRCSECYRDQAIVLLRMIYEQEAEKSYRRYILRHGIDVVWRGRRINMTLSDDELAAALDAGFPRNYFIRINGEDGRWS